MLGTQQISPGIHARPLAQIPSELTTPLQTDVVVLLALLLEEDNDEVVVVVVLVVVVLVVAVVRVVRLVVVVVGAEIGNTTCVVAQVTTPATCEQLAVAMPVDAGKVKPP